MFPPSNFYPLRIHLCEILAKSMIHSEASKKKKRIREKPNVLASEARLMNFVSYLMSSLLSLKSYQISKWKKTHFFSTPFIRFCSISMGMAVIVRILNAYMYSSTHNQYDLVIAWNAQIIIDTDHCYIRYQWREKWAEMAELIAITAQNHWKMCKLNQFG